MKITSWFAVCTIFVPAVFCVDSVSVSVKEGDSVTLRTDIQAIQQEAIIWFYDDIRIAQASLDSICTDVQCNEVTERFRGRLKLDKQTGSLTIINTRITDSGEYIQEIIKPDDVIEKTFSVTVYAVFYADSAVVSVKEGDSVTLHTDIQQEAIRWYYDDIRIAEASLDSIFTDVQCNEDAERFRGRLKLDKQTGSLTIINTRSTDTGIYILEIISNGRMSEKTFSVTVSGSGLPAGAVAGITVVVFLPIIAATVTGILVYCRKLQARRKVMALYKHDQVNIEGDLSTEEKAYSLLNEKDVRREAESPGDLRMESLQEQSAIQGLKISVSTTEIRQSGKIRVKNKCVAPCCVKRESAQRLRAVSR